MQDRESGIPRRPPHAHRDDLLTIMSSGELRRTPQPVEKPLYASSGSPSRAQKTRYCSVLALISKCLDAVLDYPLVLGQVRRPSSIFGKYPPSSRMH
jgi:hypothetical protein